MGQHRHAITGIYQLTGKNPQSAFLTNPLRTSQIQGAGRTVLSLWDGSESILVDHGKKGFFNADASALFVTVGEARLTKILLQRSFEETLAKALKEAPNN